MNLIIGHIVYIYCFSSVLIMAAILVGIFSSENRWPVALVTMSFGYRQCCHCDNL